MPSVFPTAYFGSIAYYRALAAFDSVEIEAEETYPKQTIRNRTLINTSNGDLRLSIPVEKPKGSKSKSGEVTISDRSKWRAEHWRAIKSAYSSAPYFDHYGVEVEELIFSQESNLIAFNNQSTAFQPAPVPATSINIDAGKSFIRGLRAGGGTKLLPALQMALGQERDESTPPRYLILMSDALVGNDHSILQYLKNPKFQDARVFPISFGASPNHYLTNRAAELGRGFTLQVTNQDNAAAICGRFNELTKQPYMTDVQIDWGSLKVKDQIPARLPDLYAGKPLVVLARYDRTASETITLKGNVSGQAVQLDLELELPAEEASHDSIASVWARQRIRQIWNENVGNETASSKAEITRLGIEHQLVTQYTSFIAVEKELSSIPEGELLTKVSPNLLPEGMNQKTNNNSASNSPSSAPSPQSKSSGDPAVTTSSTQPSGTPSSRTAAAPNTSAARNWHALSI